MKTKKSTFCYRTPTPTKGWGCRFDSLAELRFAISVLDEYAIIRSPISIYFHKVTGECTHIPKAGYLRYTPDFLIRNHKTLQAFLIEIKPRAFEHQPCLEMHKRVANHYIQSLRLDWQYKVTYDDQILLTEEQLKQYEDCLRLSPLDRFLWYKEYYKRITGYTDITAFSSNPVMDFLIYGYK